MHTAEIAQIMSDAAAAEREKPTTHPTALTKIRKCLKRRVKDHDINDFQIAPVPGDRRNLYRRLVRVQVGYAAAVDLTLDLSGGFANLQLWNVAKGRVLHRAYTPACYRTATLADLDSAVDAVIDIAHQLAGQDADPRPFPSLRKTTIATTDEKSVA